MALPPLPENNTDRLFVNYQTGGGATAQEHSFSIRYDPALANPGDILSGLGTVMNNAGFQAALFDGWRVLSAETQAEGSIFRFPVSVPAVLLGVLGNGLASATPSQQAREVRMVGRGLTSGRKVSLSVYGFVDASIAEADFRFTPAGGTALNSLLQHIIGLGLTGSTYTNIGKGPTNWYPYVNWQYNSHWETEQRA